MHALKLYLLGPPRVELEGALLRFPRRKVLALLAYLAVTGRNHSRDALAELLFPGHDRAHARADLRQTISHLRSTIGDKWLTADGGAVALAPEHGAWVDVDAFRRMARQAGKPHEGPELLARAAALYRGEFLAGFYLRDSPAFEDWQLLQAEDCFRQALELFDSLGDHGNTALMLSRLALLARARGRHNRAACLLAACTATQMALFGPEAAQRLEQTGELANAVAEYKDAYAASWVRCQSMGLEQAIGFARSPAKYRLPGPRAPLAHRGEPG